MSEAECLEVVWAEELTITPVASGSHRLRSSMRIKPSAAEEPATAHRDGGHFSLRPVTAGRTSVSSAVDGTSFGRQQCHSRHVPRVEGLSMPDSRVTVAMDFFQKLFGGNVSSACDLLDPQVVDVVPGAHAASGVFQGVQAVAAHLSTFLRLTEDPIDVLEWEDWMAGVDNVAGLAKIHLQRVGQQHDFRVIFLVTVTDDDGPQRISRIESFYSDQAAFDRFFSVEP